MKPNPPMQNSCRIVPQSLSAADTLSAAKLSNAVKLATDAAKTVVIENLKASEEGFSGALVEIKGANLSLNADLSTEEKLAEFWRGLPDDEYALLLICSKLPDSNALSLSGNGSMLRGGFIIKQDADSFQFTIERGIKFLHTDIYVGGGAKLIFKGEFISSPYLAFDSLTLTPIISIIEASTIDFNEATLNPDHSVPIELYGGRMIRDHHSVTKNHTLTFNGNSSFEGNLSIASGAKLTVCPDFCEENAKLQISGSLNFAKNSSIDFQQSINMYEFGSDKLVELKSGRLIAHAACINGNLAGIVLTESIINYEGGHYESITTTTQLNDMKLISVKNGENYDLILQRISSADKK